MTSSLPIYEASGVKLRFDVVHFSLLVFHLSSNPFWLPYLHLKTEVVFIEQLLQQ